MPAKKFLKAAYQEKKEQAALKKKYDVQTDAIIIEKKNALVQFWRITLKACGIALRVIASIAIAILAIMGLCVLIYPTLRADFHLTGPHKLLLILLDRPFRCVYNKGVGGFRTPSDVPQMKPVFEMRHH